MRSNFQLILSRSGIYVFKNKIGSPSNGIQIAHTFCRRYRFYMSRLCTRLPVFVFPCLARPVPFINNKKKFMNNIPSPFVRVHC